MFNIAIDLHGVICDFVRAFNREMNKVWPDIISEDAEPTDYDMDKWYPDLIAPVGVHEMLDRLMTTPNLWRTLPAYKDEVKELRRGLRTLCEAGINVWYVTHAPEVPGATSLQQIHQWLYLHELERSNTSVIIVPNSDRKVLVYEALDIRCSLDDKFTTVEQCERLPQHRAFLFDRPWNQHCTVQRRTNHITTFIQYVLMNFGRD